ncbi:NifU family protein [Planktothrix sp. FACHB-1355]|uniref:NifU family protein n=1 Tax=Aerosakkonema funiforme FACHB-1375 TaxID=2949571 RepID=A0A926ZHY3_9CYAN|nr:MULTISPECIES: NifU family protein [Oscillatoriales]MBD2183545.1 NifU family protein [Aerosakkonema funiforme FACHB-1375]MBD3561281.1 NifU family protein [Planktothrix sp. FACHB-1355]
MTNDDRSPTLEELVREINRYEAIASEWDESQRVVLMAWKRAMEALHREALIRLIRSVKQDSLSALRRAAEDEVVYGVLRYYDLVKSPQPPLEERIKLALAEVRPGLQSHNGDVELVAIDLPTVKVRLIGNCSNCPASTLTLSDSVEQAIKRYCPEITQVIAVQTEKFPASQNLSENIDSDRIELTSLAEVPTQGILAMKLLGKSLILFRIGSQVVCYENACSHFGEPLDAGDVSNGILTCPSHKFRYRLETGECLTSPEIPLQSYPVQVQDGRVFVQIKRSTN